MSQYVLSRNYGEYDLLYALETYEPVRLVLSAFSLGNRDINARSIEKSEIHNLEFTIGTQWRITESNTLFATITPDDLQCFKLEYQDERFARLYPHYSDPNDVTIPKPTYSVFRNVVDEYLLEISFVGKIPLEPEGKFWKVKRQ